MVSRLNYRSLVAEGSFIDQYMKTMDDIETPYAYDFWAACWLMSVALGREITIARPRAPVFMNMYLILTAESGVTRKSTAVRQALNVASAFLEQHAPHMAMVQNATTPRKLLLSMNELTHKYNTAQLVLSAEELVTILGKHNYQMPGFLTDFYDCPSSRTGGTYAEGHTINIRNSFVCFIGASTPTWLTSHITTAVIEGGFTSRCLFIVAEDRKRRIAWPSDKKGSGATDRLVQLLRRLRDNAVRINTQLGGIPISKGGIDEFSEWYSRRDEHRDAFRASFEAREDHHVLRLAGLLCVSDGLWEIQWHHIRQAIKIIRAVKEDAADIFNRNAYGVSRAVQGIDAICSRLIAAGRGGLSQSQLRGMVQRYMNSEHLNLCLACMHSLDMVQKFEIKESKYGKPLTLWRATARIRNRGAQAAILREFEQTLTAAENPATWSGG